MPLHMILIAIGVLALLVWLAWAEGDEADLSDGAEDQDA